MEKKIFHLQVGHTHAKEKKIDSILKVQLKLITWKIISILIEFPKKNEFQTMVAVSFTKSKYNGTKGLQYIETFAW